jgi:hypothetical protein
MELLLNLAWLVIALLAICLLRGNWRRRKGPPLHKWVALATFLFLLFPVISLTDDLHPEIALAEAATGKRNFHLLSAHGSDSQSHPSHSPDETAIAVRNQSFHVRVATFSLLIETNVSKTSSAPAKETSGRSPPSVLL